MIKSLLFFLLFTVPAVVSFSQANAAFEKECRITTGLGFAGATKNTKSAGRDVWVQLDYKLSATVSVATEFENMTYQKPGYYKSLPVNPNEIKVVDNNFSLLLKYHIPLKSTFKVAVASGWTYTTRQSDYYIYESNAVSQQWFRNVTSFSDYRIPLLIEIEHTLYKTINVQARVKYNLNSENGNTYSSGIGVSLKL